MEIWSTSLERFNAGDWARQLYRGAGRMWMAESVHRSAAARWKNTVISPCPETPDLERGTRFLFLFVGGKKWIDRNTELQSGIRRQIHAERGTGNAMGSRPY